MGRITGLSQKPTCDARETESSRWYDLTYLPRPSVILPKIQQYRLIAFLNPDNLYQNSSLLGLYNLSASEADYFAGLLNSTFGILPRLLFARGLGNEGNTQLDVYSAKMLLVAAAPAEAVKRKVELAFRKLAERKALSFVPERRMRAMAFERANKSAELEDLSDLCELDMADRRELDHAVLELLGISTKKARDQWIDKLYAYLREFFEETRRKEELAIVNKNVTQRKGAVSPQDLAIQISHELHASEPQLFKTYRDFFRDAAIGDNWIGKEVPAEGSPVVHVDMHDIGLRFMRGKKQLLFMNLPTVAHTELAAVAIIEMRREMVKLPREEADCKSLLQSYQAFLTKRDIRLRELVAERVADEEVQAKTFDLLVQQVRQGHQPPTV